VRGPEASFATPGIPAQSTVGTAGGVLVLGEDFSSRLVIASFLTLGGIALAVVSHQRRSSSGVR
jgi:drug/metabolite transporter (DMT)-like permease